MDFSKLIHDKIKFFVLLVSVFIFLSLFFALNYFFEIPMFIYIIWLFLYAAVVLLSGFIYGFLTKSRVKAVLLGFSFPIVFDILQHITLSLSYPVDYVNAVPPSYSLLVPAKFILMLLNVAILNSIACWFVSTTAESEKRKKISYLLSIVFIELSFVFMIFVVFNLVD